MPLQPLPPKFKHHEHSFSFDIKASEEKIWKWLNNTDTFTKSQVWPWKVEFYSPNESNIPNGFNEKVLTNHFGPFISLPGELTKVTKNYRDLQYFYGSYAISHRWIRPYQLEFETHSKGEETKVVCHLKSYVKPWIYSLWSTSQKIFWSRFPKWAKKSIS